MCVKVPVTGCLSIPCNGTYEDRYDCPEWNKLIEIRRV